MTKTVNIKKPMLVCAFCTHWYDPGNQHIRPVGPSPELWEFDKGVKSYCERDRKDRNSEFICIHFEKKTAKS
jgi:hypothetical protein